MSDKDIDRLEFAVAGLQELIDERSIHAPLPDEQVYHWVSRLRKQMKKGILMQMEYKSSCNRFDEVWAALAGDESSPAEKNVGPSSE